MQRIGASQEIALLLFLGCTEVDFTAEVVVVAAGLCSAMILIFSVVNVCFCCPEIYGHNSNEKKRSMLFRVGFF
jgi:hypothetical protein